MWRYTAKVSQGDKLALIEAIRQRHLDDVLTVLAEAANAKRGPRMVEGPVRGMVDVHSRQPGLRRVLLDAAPRHDGSPDHEAFERECARRCRSVVAAHASRTKGTSIDVVARVLSGAIEGVIHNAARAGTLNSPRLKRELVRLVTSYLDSRAS